MQIDPTKPLFTVGQDVWPHIGHRNRFTDLLFELVESQLGSPPWRIDEVTHPSAEAPSFSYAVVNGDGHAVTADEITFSDVHVMDQVRDVYGREARETRNERRRLVESHFGSDEAVAN
jgi:hypothetical protein